VNGACKITPATRRPRVRGTDERNGIGASYRWFSLASAGNGPPRPAHTDPCIAIGAAIPDVRTANNCQGQDFKVGIFSQKY
jgi:hypothetical protein